jgi:hypothetical protein
MIVKNAAVALPQDSPSFWGLQKIPQTKTYRDFQQISPTYRNSVMPDLIRHPSLRHFQTKLNGYRVKHGMTLILFPCTENSSHNWLSIKYSSRPKNHQISSAAKRNTSNQTISELFDNPSQSFPFIFNFYLNFSLIIFSIQGPVSPIPGYRHPHGNLVRKFCAKIDLADKLRVQNH